MGVHARLGALVAQFRSERGLAEPVFSGGLVGDGFGGFLRGYG